MFDIGV